MWEKKKKELEREPGSEACTKLFPFTQILDSSLHTQANVLTQSTDFEKLCIRLFLFLAIIYACPRRRFPVPDQL